MRIGRCLEAGHADRVILATPAPTARILYKEPSAIELELMSTDYRPTLVVAFAIKDSYHPAPRIADLYGILIPGTERHAVSAISNEGNKEQGRAAHGFLLLAFLSDKGGAEMFAWKDEDILAAVLKEVEKYYVGVSDDILFTRIYRWKEAMPLSPPGKSRNVARYRQGVNGSTRVYLAGDYLGMPFTEGAAETGRWAAQALLRNLV